MSGYPSPVRVTLHHTTRYAYDRPVTFSPHVVRLRPAPHTRSTVEAYTLKIIPEKHFLNWQQDPFGNFQARLVFLEPAAVLEVEVDLVVDLITVNPFDFFLEEDAEKHPLRYEPALKRELQPYFDTLPVETRMAGLIGDCRTKYARAERRTIDVLVDINQHVQRALRYDIRMEPGVFTPERTLTLGHGSCRDFAWLQCQLLRHLGFATRFASGYSIQLRPDEKPVTGPAGVADDVADLHAWTEVFLPGAGWVGFDATSGLLAGEGHIPLACTPEPGSAAPVTGTFAWDKRNEDDKLGESFSFAMTVARVAEAPRSTKPYSDEAWARVQNLGEVVDRALEAQDVRLSMGGEPTFVSSSEPDAPEWNTAALGGAKFRLADTLARRLKGRFAPGGVLHHGQGKWYPGEPLPRWAIGCFYRTDQVPIWEDAGMLVAEDGLRPAHTAAEAFAFVVELARRLGVAANYLLPGYEDVWYYLWRERNLPVNVDPLDARLDDELERKRLAKVFGNSLGSIVGYALPLARDADRGWRSGPWHLRREHLFLLPGDSPMGYRLPLDSLPWVAPGDQEAICDPDPLAQQPPLPARVLLQAAPAAQGIGNDRPPAKGQSASALLRTALCVEPRGGILHVFLPPVSALEAYIELVSAIEGAAVALSLPVRLEGYPPPADARLVKFELTPDPGVIEVNIQPSYAWQGLTEVTTVLYEEARQVGLSTEKFDLDGRHSGTGGGNHITLGGRTPADSPLLRRPDLLRSLVAYWNNHPSLSYLFSGLLIGPTSQAPRVDEARQDSLAELDIAFRQIEPGATCVPWRVDRLFRHLLVDLTGNTHRAEFCIDKLYNPDVASGRQGILELRNFEMPPHARMSLAQQLLVRGLVAMVWRTPYQQRLVRWGTALHDRFMLPYFVHEDLEDVIADLANAGFGFEVDWFRPHFEFRFPFIGAINVRSLDVELRRALEPWHVLAEQGAVGGTARYVDSSLERLQIRVRNLTDGRHVLLCNGRRLPLTSTGSPGEFVAGVRFRAWQPPEALHPNIPVHAPLVFDVFDEWNGRAVGGCTYHVSHPGGLSFDARPRNALEAESRRKARFLPFGHSPGPGTAPAEEANPLFPLTLDLRR
jgi:uncharacterized protein (DUF2126 family)/transglutaminase-like putative cysteine protease